MSKERISKSSPKGGKRGCLCKDGKYSAKCCDGSLQAQGIGDITTDHPGNITNIIQVRQIN